MSDESKLANEQMRGIEAQTLLQNPLLVEAFNRIETEIYEQWKLSKANEEDARQKLYMMNRLLANLKTCLETHVTTGKMASQQLIQLRDKRQWFGRT